MSQEPQIIELDPEKSPRMIAMILLVCGLLGVGFMVVNSFMGDEPNLVESEWDNGTEPVNQRFDVMPNLVRGKQAVGESDEDEDSVRIKGEAEKLLAAKKKPTSAPVSPWGPRVTTPAAGTTTPPAAGGTGAAGATGGTSTPLGTTPAAK